MATDAPPPRATSFLEAHTTSVSPTTLSTAPDCPICLEPYTEEYAVQITGIPPCTHTIGLTCLTSLLSITPGSAKRCPLCRTLWLESTEPATRTSHHGETGRRRGGVRGGNEDEDVTEESFSAFTRDIEGIRERAGHYRNDFRMRGRDTRPRTLLFRSPLSGRGHAWFRSAEPAPAPLLPTVQAGQQIQTGLTGGEEGGGGDVNERVQGLDRRLAELREREARLDERERRLNEREETVAQRELQAENIYALMQRQADEQEQLHSRQRAELRRL